MTGLSFKYLCQRLHLRVRVIRQVQRQRFRQCRFFRRAVFQFSVMRDYAVLQFVRELHREIRDRAHCLSNHLHSDHDMPDELTLVRIIIVRERGQFSCLTDIMAHRRGKKQVPVQDRICSGKIFAHAEDAQRMLQKSSREPMVHRLCS